MTIQVSLGAGEPCFVPQPCCVTLDKLLTLSGAQLPTYQMEMRILPIRTILQSGSMGMGWWTRSALTSMSFLSSARDRKGPLDIGSPVDYK